MNSDFGDSFVIRRLMERYLANVGSTRNRAGSLGDLEESLKRKRTEENSEKVQEDEQIFKKSNKIQRSPEKTQKGNMEEVIGMLTDIKRELKEIKESGKQLQKDNEEMREALKNYQAKTEAENQVLRQELVHLQGKIQQLEEKEERREKMEKKTNIIITEKLEKKTKESQEETKQHVQQLCKWITGRDIELEQVYCLTTNKAGLDVIRVKVKTFEDKLNIMRNKYKLGTRKEKVFIEDDLTREEARVQKILREKAQEERRKGNQTKIGYRKIKINDAWIEWKDLEKKE